MPRGKCHNKRYWFINEYDYDVMIEMIQYYENIEYNNPSFVKSYVCPFKAKQLINEIVKTQNLVTKIFGK